MSQSQFTQEQQDRFWSKVAVSDPTECWEWQGCRKRKGYGWLSIGNKRYVAHRVAFLLQHGEIPAGLCVLHRCDNPPCCNPAHLVAGTHQDNMADRDAKGRGYRDGPGRNCPYGERSGQAKLTDDKVREMRTLASEGIPLRVLARTFGVGHATVHAAITHQTWKHVS